MGDERIDLSSFASILEGVRKMREAYEPTAETLKAAETSVEGGNTRSTTTSNPPDRASDGGNGTGSATVANSSNAPTTSIESRRQNAVEIPNSTPQNLNTATTGFGPSISRSAPQAGSNTSGHPNTARATGARRAAQSVHTHSSVQVAQSQKGNPLLESQQMKITSWAYNNQILLDYYINATLQVLFLSLKYHKLRPEYVWRRIERLNGGSSTERLENDQALRVLLVVVDIDLPQEAIRSLLGICIKHDLSMVVAWSFEEAGNYIAYFKQNEMARSRVESSIQGLRKDDYNSNITSTLTTVRAVNKTDVVNLLANCKSFKNVVLQALEGDDLANIQGLGERKLHNLKAVFTEPFIYNKEYS